jgi:tetratricopeptide (TPR) repeat protein
VKALQEAKFAEAEKLVREALELNPSNPDGHFNLAVALLQQQKWDEGEQELKKTAALAAQLSELPMKTGGANPYVELKSRVEMVAKKVPSLKLRTQADKALAAKNFDEAAALYRRALEAEKDSDLYYNLAVALGNSRKYDEAIAALDQAMQIKPDDAQFKDLKKRLIDYKQNEVLIKAQGTMAEANKLFDAKDYAGALKAYEAIMPTVPEKSQAPIWFQIGRAQAALKQVAPATESFKRAMALAPTNAEYRKALAQHYLNEKLFQEALDLYSEAGAGESQPLDQTLFALGGRLSAQGNADVAQLAYERALKANPNHAEAHYELGMLLYYGKKEDARAKELLTKYVELGKDKGHLDNAKTVLVVIQRRMSKPKN